MIYLYIIMPFFNLALSVILIRQVLVWRKRVRDVAPTRPPRPGQAKSHPDCEWCRAADAQIAAELRGLAETMKAERDRQEQEDLRIIETVIQGMESAGQKNRD